MCVGGWGGGEVPTPQHTSTTKNKNTNIFSIPQVAIMPREMQREVNMGVPLENRLHIDYCTHNHPTQLHAANDIDCSFMATLSWESQQDPEL